MNQKGRTIEPAFARRNGLNAALKVGMRGVDEKFPLCYNIQNNIF